MQYRPEQKSLFENVFLQKFSQKNTKMCFFSFRTFNVHEILSMLEDDGTFEQADIFIEPPEFEADTDEDSGEEDGVGAPSNLNRNQLSASASVTM